MMLPNRPRPDNHVETFRGTHKETHVSEDHGIRTFVPCQIESAFDLKDISCCSFASMLLSGVELLEVGRSESEMERQVLGNKIALLASGVKHAFGGDEGLFAGIDFWPCGNNHYEGIVLLRRPFLRW